MLKPSDLSTTDPLTLQMEQVEAYIDSRLGAHPRSGPWPLIIQAPRSGWSVEAIRGAINKYRAHGWAAMTGPTALCAIMPYPDGATANSVDAQLEAALSSTR